MIKKDPSHRLSAEEYMIQQRGKAFPEYFYTFLKIYLQQFVSTPVIPPDDRISKWEWISTPISLFDFGLRLVDYMHIDWIRHFQSWLSYMYKRNFSSQLKI